MSREIKSVQSLELISNLLLENISLSVISIGNSNKGATIRSFRWGGCFRRIINKEYEAIKTDRMIMTECRK
jgi:hypothetical protein